MGEFPPDDAFGRQAKAIAVKGQGAVKIGHAQGQHGDVGVHRACRALDAQWVGLGQPVKTHQACD